MKLQGKTLGILICTLAAYFTSTTIESGSRPVRGKMPQRTDHKVAAPSSTGAMLRRSLQAPISLDIEKNIPTTNTIPAPDRGESTKMGFKQRLTNFFAPKPATTTNIPATANLSPTITKARRYFTRKKEQPIQESALTIVNRLMNSREIQTHLASIGDGDQRAYWQNRIKARLFEHMNLIRPNKDRRYARLLRDAKRSLPREVSIYPDAQELTQHVDHLMSDKRLQHSLQSIRNADHREYLEALLRVEFFDMLSTSQNSGKTPRSRRRRITV